MDELRELVGKLRARGRELDEWVAESRALLGSMGIISAVSPGGTEAMEEDGRAEEREEGSAAKRSADEVEERREEGGGDTPAKRARVEGTDTERDNTGDMEVDKSLPSGQGEGEGKAGAESGKAAPAVTLAQLRAHMARADRDNQSTEEHKALEKVCACVCGAGYASFLDMRRR